MKIRTGFVSNSSSSSFICEVSGEDYSGMDAGLEDAEMYQCTAGHTFGEQYLEGSIEEAEAEYRLDGGLYEICYDLFKKAEPDKSWWRSSEEVKAPYLIKAKEIFNNYPEDKKEDLLDNAEMYDFRYSIPVENCPICTLSHITDETLVSYMTKSLGKTKDQLGTEIKSKYSTLKELQDEN